MILADKILNLRKKCGWSQEELADKMEVSRQSISKWESAQSIPDINKILELARLFGVSTDYLLKDEMEQEEFTGMDEEPRGRVVTLREANDYMASKVIQGRQIGFGVLLCILSPVLLIVLAGLSEYPSTALFHITEGAASGIGVSVLLLMVAVAVAIFIISGMKFQRFDYLQKGGFTLEYGVAGVVREKSRAYEKRYTTLTVIGVVLCILSPVPLVASATAGAPDIIYILLTGLLLVLVGIAVFLFIRSGSIKESYDQLLKEGEYDAVEIERNRPASRFGGFFWPIVTAAYLAWSFISRDWHITWVIWPVAGLLFAAISAMLKKEE